MCSPPGRKMVTAATVATKSASIWEVQQLVTTVLRAEPWAGSKVVPEFSCCSCPDSSCQWITSQPTWAPRHWCCCISLQCCGWCTKAAPLGRSLWHNTLLSQCRAVSQHQCRSCRIALARDLSRACEPGQRTTCCCTGAVRC